MSKDIETKFQCYVSFGIKPWDTTPDAPDDSGMVEIPVVIMDGEFTIEDLDAIRAEFLKRRK